MKLKITEVTIDGHRYRENSVDGIPLPMLREMRKLHIRSHRTLTDHLKLHKAVMR